MVYGCWLSKESGMADEEDVVQVTGVGALLVWGGRELEELRVAVTSLLCWP